MPGPLSAPNGDARLTELSGEERVRLAAAGKLDTGKTRGKRVKMQQEAAHVLGN